MTWVLHAGADNIFIDTGKMRWEYDPWHPCSPLATEPERLLCIYIHLYVLIRFILVINLHYLYTSYLQIWFDYPLPITHPYLSFTYLHISYLLNIYTTSSKSDPASWKCAEWIVRAACWQEVEIYKLLSPVPLLCRSAVNTQLLGNWC